MPSNAYIPADGGITFDALAFLQTAPGKLLRARVGALADPAQPAVADVTRLRQEFSADAVRAALAIGGLQKKAREKFPELSYVWSPPEALEQATHSAVARLKAARFAAAHEKTPELLFDLCCGIGGDTVALAQIGGVEAVDLSAVRLACLRYNLAEKMPRYPVETREADVTTFLANLPSEALVHIDPARRSSGRRSPRFDDMQPGPEVLRALLDRAAGVAIKLSPAVEFDSLPPGHLELISHRGSVGQAVLWTGELAFAPDSQRTATVIARDGIPWSFTAAPAEVQAEGESLAAGNTLYELDGALTRARLAAPFSHGKMSLLTHDGGYGFSARDDLAEEFPCVTAFKILEVHPFSEQRISQILQRLPSFDEPATVEVKSRGNLPGVDTDHLQVAWSRVARGRWTVLLYRHGDEVYAAITQRQRAVFMPHAQ